MVARLHVQELVVSQDYGQFYLTTDEDIDGGVLLDDAYANGGVGQEEPGFDVLVRTPHQNNFELGLRVELWNGRPPDDLDDWQEASEAWVEVTDFGLWYGSPIQEYHRLEVPPGEYAVRIAGRGLTHWGWPGTTTPGDTWRIQLWPSDEPFPARKLRTWSGWEPLRNGQNVR
ncbi:hypothetical protein [Cryptosporangium minutisporangium]